MLRRKNTKSSHSQNDNQNFWISYADLMAGLLFVFILLVGAIVIKYVFIQTDLQAIRVDLEKEKAALHMSDKQLEKKKKVLEELNGRLKKSKEERTRLAFELSKAQNLYDQTMRELKDAKALSEQLESALKDKDGKLKLSIEQIEKITAILADRDNKIKLLNEDVEKQKADLASKIEEISLNKEELEKLKKLLLGYELKEKEFNDYRSKLEHELNETKNIITLKADELAALEKKLLVQSKEHQKLVEEFDIAKVKIKNLTGIRIKVITALKEKLGKSIDIDPKSGSLRFSSNILFNVGQYKLKKGAKKELSKLLKKYIHTLLLDKNIRRHIESIVIEGHTDTTGSYMVNLELSQKRALEVMKFLYSLNFKDKKLLEKYISASGRSYSQAIYNKNGRENRSASRRIEIKFTLKNEQAIKEIENYLEAKKK
jgi:chemotaxis protein MotB